jgi:adenine-specific DNA-methyltransferase
MMYPRLTLLRELLADDGIILVSIDDNEMHNLRALMDEVFGNGPAGEPESNFMGCVVWKTRNTDNRVKTNLSEDHEYVLVYRKSPAGAWNGRVIDRSDFQNPDDDKRGPYVTDPLTGKATAASRPNLHFVITNPETGDAYPPDPSRGWITDLAGIQTLLAEKRVWWPPDPATGKPRKKRFLSETAERMPESSFWADVRGQSGADELDQILGERLFDFPKLTAFVTRLIDVSCGTDALILDCTAGSGTTGHAVLALNSRDGGSRRFVLVQKAHDTKEQVSKELNICEAVTAKRIRKAVEGYNYNKPKRGGGTEHVEVEPLGGSFTYARVGDPLFGEYKDFGDTLPPYEDIAKYVFYTETSREFPGTTKRQNPAWDKKTGRIGEHGGRSYYLLYEPNEREDRGLDRKFLKNVASQDPNSELVVYCERLAVHQDELRTFRREHGKRIRPMLVPFNLK